MAARCGNFIKRQLFEYTGIPIEPQWESTAVCRRMAHAGAHSDAAVQLPLEQIPPKRYIGFLENSTRYFAVSPQGNVLMDRPHVGWFRGLRVHPAA